MPDNICTKSRNPFLCLIASLTNSHCPVYCNRNSGDCPNVFSLSNRLCDEPNISPLHRFLFLAVPTGHQKDFGASGCTSRSHGCITSFRLCLQIIKRTPDSLDAILGHIGVYLLPGCAYWSSEGLRSLWMHFQVTWVHNFFPAVPADHQKDSGASGCTSRSHGCITSFRLCLQIIKRTPDSLDAILGHIGVYLLSGCAYWSSEGLWSLWMLFSVTWVYIFFLAVPTDHQTDCGSSGCSSRSHGCISLSSCCSCARATPGCSASPFLLRGDEWHRNAANHEVRSFS